ncbi:MAG: hypothetical protein IJ141_08550 [Lachnospiraceae bacterium]|nr:hypothetical protein [Lachnospiraceae bacterium]
MKLKKYISILAASLIIIMSLTACGNSNASGKKTGTVKGVSDVLDEGVAKEESKTEASSEEDKKSEEAKEEKLTEATEISTEETTEEIAEEETTSEEEMTEAVPKEATVIPPEIDIDLTTLSSTMVYSEVYNMMTEPDGYMGKTIKMSGPFAVYIDDVKNKTYFACIIQDATACCSQGIEFQLDGDYSYPEDYPEVNDIVTVTGTFSTYEEDGYMYVTLLNAKMN